MPDAPESTSPYTALAVGYDLVMEHVDYHVWAGYIHQLLQQHGTSTGTILELGCGTGSLALQLQPMGDYDYLATDRARTMLRVAEIKADEAAADISFAEADFTNFAVQEPVDAVLLLYDGLNYLLEKADIRKLLANVQAALRPGGLFCFDQSTPFNSVVNNEDFEDAGEAEGFSYIRASQYDAETRLHTTAFEITIDGDTYHESHVQRAYDVSEIRNLLEASGLREVAAYDNFSTEPATEDAQRVHWVAQRPPVPDSFSN